MDALKQVPFNDGRDIERPVGSVTAHGLAARIAGGLSTSSTRNQP
jgi:hypothetical protein